MGGNEIAARISRRAVGLGVALALATLGATPPALPSPAQGGTELWVRRFTSPADNGDSACCVAASPDGSRVFVVGHITHGGFDADFATVAYSATTGVMLWARYYDGGEGDDYPSALVVSPDGSKVFVTGSSGALGSSLDIVTIAYDAVTGRVMWGRTYDSGPGLRDEPHAIASSPDGSAVFVAGAGFTDFVTIAYDAATGADRWVSRYDGPDNGSDEALSITTSHDGSAIFVAGVSETVEFDDDYATVAYDAFTGEQLWVASYAGEGGKTDEASAVVVSPDDSRVFVSGQSVGTFFWDWATVAYDSATGATEWVRRYTGPTPTSNEFNPSMVADPHGSTIFVAGNSGGEFTTIAYDEATGTARWARRYHGPGGGGPLNGIASSPDGSTIFVTGENESNRGDDDYATIAYDAGSGDVMWAKRFDAGHRGDFANAVGVSPDDTAVFVTGASGGGATGLDMVTIKYEA